MMLYEDPLDNWRFMAGLVHDRPPTQVAEYQTFIRESLDHLEQLLDHNEKADKKRNLSDSHLAYPFMRGAGSLPAADLHRAQQLFLRLARIRGPGSAYIQDGLLSVIALSLNPSINVPFLVELLDFRTPKDTLAGRRRRLALAALALLASETNDPASYTALQQAVQHARPDVRGMAVGYLGRAYLDVDRPFPQAVQEHLQVVATNDPAFVPRYKARLHLQAAGLPTPLDHPDGVYRFKVAFLRAPQISRTIAMRSTHTLHTLHLAIQNALDWDNDHLYAFFLHGKRGDDPDARVVGPWEYEQGDDRQYQVSDELVLGAIGFIPKQTFLYLFDYGDNHEFTLTVVGIDPQAEPGDYPRVVDSQGDVPAQYGISPDDEDEWEEES